MDDRLISPAAAGNALFCVEYYGGSSQIVRYALDGLDGLGEKTACGVSGLGQDFFVWHNPCATQPDGAVRLCGTWIVPHKEVLAEAGDAAGGLFPQAVQAVQRVADDLRRAAVILHAKKGVPRRRRGNQSVVHG